VSTYPKLTVLRVLMIIVTAWVYATTACAAEEAATKAADTTPSVSSAPAEATTASIPRAEPVAQEHQQEGNITLDFKDADIQTILRILAEKGNVNIIAGKDVTGTITVKLVDVPWQKALEVVLKTYDFGYEREGNVIYVSPLEKLRDQKKAQKELADIQPISTEVFVLEYLDANDAKKVIDPQLSPQGKSAVLGIQPKKGWKFASASGGGSSGVSAGKLERVDGGDTRSKTLVVSDIPAYIEKVREILRRIDVQPRQIMIETKIVEVSKNKLTDLGIDWGTGETGATSTALEPQQLNARAAIGTHSLTGQTTPSNFNPKATGLTPDNSGFKFLYQKLTGDKLQIILHALSEDVNTNMLSNPRIMTLENQEATILVGTKYPILETSVAGTDTTTTTTTMKYYQDIGIQLNVVPQISGDHMINLIVHPAVTSYTDTLKAKSSSGTVLAEYPIINTREAETQILMTNGDTIVIGGLLKDAKSKSVYSVPILGKIPLLGSLFRRDANDVEKIDLLIFITAKIVDVSDQR